MDLKDFFNDEFKVFSNLDNVRSIPSLIDGFKDSQRKAVYGMIQHGQSEIKVAQAAGQFSLITHYAHGENSMAETIVGLAQSFPGANNINLFEPIGQFGSILCSQSASYRYIYTKPSPNLRKYIKVDDDCILDYRYEDEDKAEPKCFYPIAPFWILNGSIGIGTGHSVKILPRNPENVLKAITMIMKGKSREQIEPLLIPSFSGWSGTIETSEAKQHTITGVINKVNTTTLRVTELPPSYGIDKFKAILVDLMDKDKVKDFDNNSTEEGFDIVINVPREVGKMELTQLIQLFKLSTKVTENITLWNNGNLRRYDHVYDALVEFVDHRLTAYTTRKQKHLEMLSDRIDILVHKALFITAWHDIGDTRKLSTEEIKELMITTYEIKGQYIDSFLMMRLTSLTLTLIKELESEIVKLRSDKQQLEQTSITELYLTDLKGVK